MIKGLAKLLKNSWLTIDGENRVLSFHNEDGFLKTIDFQEVDSISRGYVYEKFVGQKFEKCGHKVIYRGLDKGFNDGGIDLIVEKADEIYFIQCKYFTNRRLGKNDIEYILYKAGNSINRQQFDAKATFALVIPEIASCFSSELVCSNGIRKRYRFPIAEYFLSKNFTQSYVKLEIIEIPMYMD